MIGQGLWLLLLSSSIVWASGPQQSEASSNVIQGYRCGKAYAKGPYQDLIIQRNPIDSKSLWVEVWDDAHNPTSRLHEIADDLQFPELPWEEFRPYDRFVMFFDRSPECDLPLPARCKNKTTTTANLQRWDYWLSEVSDLLPPQTEQISVDLYEKKEGGIDLVAVEVSLALPGTPKSYQFKIPKAFCESF